MQCSQCQAENREGRRFCTTCGAPLAVACPACGFVNEPGDAFCGDCGAALGNARPSAPARLAPEPRFTSPESYTPQHLAERIISSRGALEGERKQVTILFADLKGSTELIQGLDPEEARALLDPALQAMMDAVHRYEGTVNQVLGDGIMALFGAPIAHEDHAMRACYAALALQEALRAYGERVRRAHGVEVQARVGLNSGEVVVRAIGSDLRMDYTAVGETTHLAARMEQLATPGTIRLGPATVRLAEGLVQVRSLGPVPIKGLTGSVEVFELAGVAPTHTRLQAAAAHGLTKFVGRDAELETLRRTLEQAGAGHGQMVALVGEPGVGKSRLTWEFTHSHRTQGWLVLESRSVSYGKATAYLPVIDLLKSYCGVEDRDDPRRIREKLTGKLLTLDPALQPMVAPLLSLLDVPVDDPQWQALDPPQRRQRTLDACKRLLLRESQEQPLLLIFEDLHWIDTETQALLESLVESLPTARLLLLVNYRPEYDHSWHRRTYYQQLRLDPLPPDSAEELLAALLGDAAELEPLKRMLMVRTEGNPFFIEESVRSLVESGVLAGERGDYRLVRPFEMAQVPATVQAVLAARIDRLAPEDKRLLQAAAVVGKDVPYPLLQAIAELPDDAVRQGLARLQAAEFLYETSLFPDLEYTFKHALTHEVGYASLLQERRRALHARIVAAIEQLYPDRLAEYVELLAHHAQRGELWDKAVGYLRQAGAKAAVRSSPREAVGYYEQALDVLAHLPQERGTSEQAIDLRLDLRNALLTLGEHDRILEHLRAAEALAVALDDQRRLAWVACYMSNYWWHIRANDRALDDGRRALATSRAIGDDILELEAAYVLGRAYDRLGDYRSAVDMYGTIVSGTAGGRARERFGQARPVAVVARSATIFCLIELGETAQAIARGEELMRLAEIVDQPFSLAVASSTLGMAYAHRGELERAIPLTQRGLDLCETWQIRLVLPVAQCLLGYQYTLSGRTEEALSLLRQASSPTVRFAALVWLSQAYLQAGRREDATEHAKDALEIYRQGKERGSEAYALRALGDITANAQPIDVDQAESYYRQALSLADELGARPLVAHCHLGLGTLYHKVSSTHQAQSELTIAFDMYRSMEMTFWLAKAEAGLTQAGAA